MSSFECPICLDRLIDPIVLSCCGTTACNSCLLKLPMPRICPFDRKVIPSRRGSGIELYRAIWRHRLHHCHRHRLHLPCISTDTDSISLESPISCFDRQIHAETGWKELDMNGDSKVIPSSRKEPESMFTTQQ